MFEITPVFHKDAYGCIRMRTDTSWMHTDTCCWCVLYAYRCIQKHTHAEWMQMGTQTCVRSQIDTYTHPYNLDNAYGCICRHNHNGCIGVQIHDWMDAYGYMRMHSPDRLYKAPTVYTKPQKEYIKISKTIQIPKTLYTNLSIKPEDQQILV